MAVFTPVMVFKLYCSVAIAPLVVVVAVVLLVIPLVVMKCRNCGCFANKDNANGPQGDV